MGIQIAVYLDDGGGAEGEFDIAKRNACVVKDTLNSAGFIINESKSVWEPTRTMTWLGITMNTLENKLSISQKRIEKCKNHINRLLACPYTTARKLAKFAGMIMSMEFVLGKIVQLKTRFTYRVIESRTTWDRRINVNKCRL